MLRPASATGKPLGASEWVEAKDERRAPSIRRSSMSSWKWTRS